MTYGQHVRHLPVDVDKLYTEARRCIQTSSYTPAVLACRKLLMNVAVQQGAKEGQTFVEYVDYLAGEGFVPPNGRHWVDYIRTKSNEANHEIKLMSEDDAKQLILFSEMMLKFIYELPKSVPAPPSSP
ncbi:MAG TPA: DUF4145 domain-containing protein [Candidatus Angelobacter sp.]|nr:DUF4145 domain-containing protein [Candidatus Angelobacter sp.]